MQIIDFRYRPATEEVISDVAHNPVYAEFCKRNPAFLSQPRVNVDEAIAELEKLNVVKAVVTGRDIESTYDTPNSNKYVAELVEQNPEHFIGFYGFDPEKGVKGCRNFRDGVTSGVFKGAALDPSMNHLPPSDAKFYPLYYLCCELDVPVIITTGLSPFMPGVLLENNAPSHIDKVAVDFPELRIIVAHACYPKIYEALGVAFRNPNVFLDFSTIEKMPGAECFVNAASTTHKGKFVFASANPFASLAKAIDLYNDLPFTEQAREDIFYNTAKKILKLQD